MRRSWPSLDSIFTEFGLTTAEVAVSLNVTTEAVRLWRRGMRQLPPNYARLIEERFHIPRHRLRPDVWDPPPPTKRRSEPAQ
jgi:DNA-binding transcriptional regulator YdaS (Cro superfamily)